MDIAKDYYWNESISFLERYYSGELKYPLQSYFYIENNILHFKDKASLPPEIKKTVTDAFNAVY